MKRRTSIVCLILVLFLSGCNGGFLPKVSAVTSYRNGIEQYEKGNYKIAEIAFERAIEQGISEDIMVYVYSYLGHCHLELGEFEQAEGQYRLALLTGKEPAMCNTNLGIFYRERGEYEKAEVCYLAALDADSEYGPVLASLGILYAVEGKNDEAIRLLEKAIGSEKKPPAVYHANLAYAYAGSGKTAEAREQLAKAKQKGYPEDEVLKISAYIQKSEQKGSMDKEQYGEE